MFKSLPRAILSTVFLIICGFGLFVFVAYLYASPESVVSIFLLKVGYNLAPNKQSFLESYSPKLRDVSAGYVPSEVSDYLCYRLENTDDKDEIAAIVHFYVIQSPDRESGVLGCSKTAGEKIAGQIIIEMDDDSHFYGKIVLLEEIRRNEWFGKGKIEVGSYPNTKSFTDDLIPMVRKKYKDWWNSNLDWEEKRKINLLENTDIKVFKCCG